MKNNYTSIIAVSCIGSGVGQSVINSLGLSRLPIRTIGLGYNPYAYGAYDCDSFDYTPSIYSPDYIDALIQKCKQHEIDLVIPGHDDEAWILSKNEKRLLDEGILGIFSREELITLCRNKERMSNEMNKVSDCFVKSSNLDIIEKDLMSRRIQYPLIAKPRDGYASRGVKIIRDHSDFEEIFNDDVIQEIAIPNDGDPNHDKFMEKIMKKQNPQESEISIQLVFDKNSRLTGKMYSYNKLKNGVPIEILPFRDKKISDLIEILIPAFKKLGVRGPLNLQGRMTNDGFKIFDINPRFTGLSGLRALMGFNEVEACVKDWLGIRPDTIELVQNYNRFGTRQVADRSLSLEKNQRINDHSKRLNTIIDQDKKKNILITGSGGYLGRNLIRHLVSKDEFRIHAFDLEKDSIKDLFKSGLEGYYDLDDLTFGSIQLGNMDIIIHLGFSRPHNSNSKIADSLKFTNELFTRAAMHQVPAIINISSKSVYDLRSTEDWNEDTPVAPSIPYAQAKYATELMLRSLKQIDRSLCHTSIRLGTMGGYSEKLPEMELLAKITRKAFDEEDIDIYGGDQQIERLDIRDAVLALEKVLISDPSEWKPVYNLGSGEVHTLMDIVKRVIRIAGEHGKDGSDMNIIEDKIALFESMDSTLFMTDFDWRPEFGIDDTIRSYFAYMDSGQ